MMFKVVHRIDDTDTVYVIDAGGPREAVEETVDSFGLAGGALSAVPWGGPFRLYTLNLKTGAIE